MTDTKFITDMRDHVHKSIEFYTNDELFIEGLYYRLGLDMVDKLTDEHVDSAVVFMLGLIEQQPAMDAYERKLDAAIKEDPEIESKIDELKDLPTTDKLVLKFVNTFRSFCHLPTVDNVDGMVDRLMS